VSGRSIIATANDQSLQQVEPSVAQVLEAQFSPYRHSHSLTITEPPVTASNRIANYPYRGRDADVNTNSKNMFEAADITLGARNLSEASEDLRILLFGQYSAAGFGHNRGGTAAAIIAPTTPEVGMGDVRSLISNPHHSTT
jgi:hypothetical protein